MILLTRSVLLSSYEIFEKIDKDFLYVQSRFPEKTKIWFPSAHGVKSPWWNPHFVTFFWFVRSEKLNVTNAMTEIMKICKFYEDNIKWNHFKICRVNIKASYI